jgi:TP901 family phage tail tape measure protein
MTAIKGNEIIQDGLFDNAAKSGKELVGVLKQVEKELQDIAKTQNKIAQDTGTKDFKSLQKKTKAINEVKNATDGLTRVQKSLKRAQEDLAASTSKESKELLKTRDATNQVRKAQRDQIKTTRESSNAFKVLTKQTNDAQAKFKKLAAQFGVTSKQARKARREFQTLDNKLRKVNDAARDGRRDVGRYGKALQGIKGGIARLGLAFGGLRAITGTFSIVKDFEQSQADLASVLADATIPQLEKLTDQARKLGESTKFTATEVSNLQKEFAKLGFDTTEIENMTEATLQLAGATGTELSRAAEVAGSTVRAFGLDATDTQRVVDVMAKSFSSSSLDMEKFATAMANVAPVAKSAGLNIEQTTALLGTLTDRGIDASKAGTGLRNIFLELAKKGMSFDEAMRQISESTDKNATSLELFGKLGAVTGTILSETGADVAALEEKLNNAGGAAQEMADKQLNTLNGALALLSSAWEGFILDLSEGTGVFAGLKDIIFFVAKNLRTIIKVVSSAVVGWASYRIALKLVNRESGKFQRSGLLGFLGKMGKGLRLMTKGTRGAALGFKTMGRAIKAIPLAGIISGIATLVTSLSLFSSEAAIAAERQERLNEALEKGAKIGEEEAAKAQADISKSLEKQTLALEKQLNSAKKLGKSKADILNRGARVFEIAAQAEINKLDDLIRLRQREFDSFAGNGAKQGEISAELEKLEAKRVEFEAIAANGRIKAGEVYLAFTKKKHAAIVSNAVAEVRVLTGLAKLRKELSKTEKKRADELVANKGLETDRFKSLSDQAAVMRNQIRLYEEILKKANAVKKVEDKKKTDFGIDISTPQGLSEADKQAMKDYESNTQKLIDENEKRKQSMIDMADTVAGALTVLNNVIQKKSQQRVEAIDREIQASQTAQEVLRTISQQGVADSEENLAFEQQKQAELEQRKQKEIERAANLELVLSAVSTFNAQVQAGATPAEALGSTAVTMTALEALVSGLDLFYEGTENTGTAANPLDSNGGRLAVLHDNERVMTSAQNDVIGNMTNWELANMAGDYRQGSLGMQNAMVVQPFMGGQEILNKFDELKDSIENKPVLTSINYNDQERAMVETVESRNKLIRNHRKTGGIW